MCAAKTADELSTEELREQLNELRKDFKGLLGTVEKMTAAQAAGVSHQIRDGLRAYADKGEEAFETARGQAERVYEDLHDTVERNPMTALMIALGIGFLVGIATRPRK